MLAQIGRVPTSQSERMRPSRAANHKQSTSGFRCELRAENALRWCRDSVSSRNRYSARIFCRYAATAVFAKARMTASGAKRSYAARRGIASSTNRKNRVLRVPATTDPGDTKSPGSQPPKGGRASFSPRQSTGPRLDRPRVRSDLCRKATTSHVRTSRPTDRFLHGRNGATVDNILGSGD